MESRHVKNISDAKRQFKGLNTPEDKITDPDFDELEYFLKKQEEEIRNASTIKSNPKRISGIQ